jgi:hypothetical protein
VAATGNVRARLKGLLALSTSTLRPARHMLWGFDPAYLRCSSSKPYLGERAQLAWTRSASSAIER